ncbi:histidine kinase [Streptomyces sp. AV19]|uniref:sensor histidine kinase n=1 Tax=Streptomyces sp. AV19 TaxID=2793068 RepID=UPI001F1886EC|nr:histidine kinase [Streptomyces sp. AV19]MDG4534887.1 histidine kinase [Streptomyces sp. AV19]
MAATLRAIPRALRTDLFTLARDPMPRSVWLGPLPHLHVVLLAALLALYNASENERILAADSTVALLTMLQSAPVVLALSRPVPAWWLSTLALSLTGALAEEPGPGMTVWWPWSLSALLLHTLVLLLLALRVRPLAAVAALAVTLLAGAADIVFVVGRRPQAVTWDALVLAMAVVLGASLRQGRVARTRLAEQQELTADERARRTLLEERGRIARELHDVVAHHMSVISIQAQVAPHLVENPSPELRENLAGIRASAVEALTELRRVLGVLRSAEGPAEAQRHAPQPTLAQLDDLVAKVRAAGVTVTTATTGPVRPLSPGVELSAYRIVQEALSNAMRHAPGATVRVETAYGPGALSVRITNSAPERPAPPSPGAGHGILGMRERAAMLGGDLATGPVPGGGYEVAAVLPASPSAEVTP